MVQAFSGYTINFIEDKRTDFERAADEVKELQAKLVAARARMEAAFVAEPPKKPAPTVDPARESALRFELAKAQQEERACAVEVERLEAEARTKRVALDRVAVALGHDSFAVVKYNAAQDARDAFDVLADGLRELADDAELLECDVRDADAKRKAASARAYAAKAELVKMGVWGGEP